MPETSVSLLERLRQQPDADSWQRLVDLYTPLIRGWLQRYDVPHEDANDLIQDVMGVLVRELPQFQHSRQPGAFRSWLRTVTVHRLGAYWRSRQRRPAATGGSDFAEMLDQLEDPASGLSRLWNEEHDRHVIQRVMQLVEPEFQPTTWQAFRRVVMDGQKAAAVAAELGISVNAVVIAKSRVLHRLRQEMQGLVD